MAVHVGTLGDVVDALRADHSITVKRMGSETGRRFDTEGLTDAQIVIVNNAWEDWNAQTNAQKRTPLKEARAKTKAQDLFASLRAFTHIPDLSALTNAERWQYVQGMGDVIKSIQDNEPAMWRYISQQLED